MTGAGTIITREADIVFFLVSFLTRQYVLVFTVTGLCGVGEICIPIMGDDARNFQGRGIITVLHLCVRQFWKRWRSLIFVRCFVRFDCSNFTACPRVVTLTARQTSGVFLSVFTTTVRSALQIAASVVSSHDFVSSGGNGGNSMSYS